ncbi:hypothetical protein GJ744_007645 [Endocarpon pusillum]|uniref:Uncharacterized protein n=1 Tax=Endocarpon pusillum TaxID=364733 RepID=A0A8H7E518_9EURO|nr:hypothetical protein GJ744_007645 [Endocarpon pusillum]
MTQHGDTYYATAFQTDDKILVSTAPTPRPESSISAASLWYGGNVVPGEVRNFRRCMYGVLPLRTTLQIMLAVCIAEPRLIQRAIIMALTFDNDDHGGRGNGQGIGSLPTRTSLLVPAPFSHYKQTGRPE